MPQIRFAKIQNNDGSINIEDTLTNWARSLEYMFGHIGEDNIVNFRAEVRDSYPAHAKGKIIFYTGDNTFKGSNGTTWLTL